MRLIDADELKKAIFNHFDGVKTNDVNGYYIIRDTNVIIDNAPTIKTFTLADIEETYRKGLEKGLSEWEAEIPTGKWIKFEDDSCGLYCSICGLNGKQHFNYCPNCGASMK